MQNSALQVFVWGSQSHVEDNKQFYSSFSLNGTQYSLGDAVCLHPETESQPCYVGRVKACFCDLNPEAAEPHCIEIRWFERLTNLDARCRGQPDKEKELVELEETDVNPIGCISCKCSVFRTRSYDEALKLAKGHDGVWFFSRGVYRQETNSLVPYADLTTGALTAVGQDAKRGARRTAAMAAPEEDVADSEDTRSAKKGRMDSMRLNNGLEGCTGLPDADVERTTGRRKANNTSFMSNAPATAFSNAGAAPLPRSCVECGATQTPQWREGPHGPKTLCNACGVRYGRQQNRAGKRCGGAGVSRAAAQQSIGKGSSAVVSATPQSQVMQQNQKSAPLTGAYSTGNKQVMRSHQERGGEVGTCNQAPARPVRQAAVLAANRTAEFARTGNFPDMDEARATAVIGATTSGPSAPTAAELPVVIQPQPQQQQAQQQPQQTTSSSKAGVRRVVTPISPGQQLATMGNGTISGGRQLKAVTDSAANRSVGSLLEVKLEAADGAQLASCHESSHNSTESAQELVVGQAGDDDEARNVGVYGDCARRLRLGREEEETGLPLVGSGDFTSVMDKDGVMMLSAKDLLISSGDVLGLALPMTVDVVPSTTAQLQQHHLLHRTSCSTLPTATDNNNVNHAASHPVSSAPAMASSNAVDLRAVVARAAMWVPSISKYTGVLSCIEDVRETLPASMVDGLMALGHAVDKAAGEAAAADAALVAVHQVLLARQEEAARARSDAISVIGRLRSMMADLVDKHPPLALHSALQPELGCLTGLEELDDSMIEGCALLQPCGSPAAHMAGVLSSVGMAVDGGDDYDDVVMGGRGVHHHPIDQHSDLDDLVGSCGRQW